MCHLLDVIFLIRFLYGTSTISESFPRNFVFPPTQAPPFRRSSSIVSSLFDESSQWYVRLKGRKNDTVSRRAWMPGKLEGSSFENRTTSSLVSPFSLATLLRAVNGSICVYFFRPVSTGKSIIGKGKKKRRKEKAETIWTRRRGIIAFWNKRCFYPLSVAIADDIIHFYRQLDWICNIVILYAFKNWKTVLFSFIEFIRRFKIN